MNEVKRPRKPLMFYYAIVLLALILFNALVMPFLTNPNVTQVDYSEFMNMTNEKLVSEVMIEDNQIIISSTNDGTEEYSVQLVQPDLPVRDEHTYRVSFDIRSDEERDVVVCVSAPHAGWIRYLPDTAVDVGPEWTTYTFEFTSDQKDDNYGRLEFNMGNHGYTSTVYITNVTYEDITE